MMQQNPLYTTLKHFRKAAINHNSLKSRTLNKYNITRHSPKTNCGHSSNRILTATE